MVARLVAVRIFADDAVRLPVRPFVLERLVVHPVRFVREEKVEFLQELAAPAHRLHEPGEVVQHVEAPLVAAALGGVARSGLHGESLRTLQPARFPAFHPAAVGKTRPDPARPRLEQVAPAPGPCAEKRLVLASAEFLRHLRRAPVVERRFHEARDGLPRHYIAREESEGVQQIPVAGDERLVHPRRVRCAVVRRERALHIRPERFEIDLEALAPGVKHHGDGVRAQHVVALQAVDFPDRHLAVLLRMVVDRGDEAVDPLGRHERVERMRRAVRVPERERRIAHGGAGVRYHVGLPAEMVERRVERRLLVVRRALDLHAGENVVPRRTRGDADRVEVPSLRLGAVVAERAVRRGVGYRHADLQRPARLDVEVEHPAVAVLCGKLVRDDAPVLYRTAERGVEEDAMERPVLAHETRTGHGETVIRKPPVAFYRHLVRPLRFADESVLEIDEKMRRAVAVIRVAVERHAVGAGQFRAHLRVVERDRVVSGARRLVRVREAAFAQNLVAAERKKQDVPLLALSASAEVALRKAHDRLVGVLVSGAVAPAAGPRVRPGLHHRERTHRPRIAVPLVVCSDERIHECGVVRRERGSRRTENKRGQRNPRHSYPRSFVLLHLHFPLSMTLTTSTQTTPGRRDRRCKSRGSRRYRTDRTRTARIRAPPKLSRPRRSP